MGTPIPNLISIRVFKEFLIPPQQKKTRLFDVSKSLEIFLKILSFLILFDRGADFVSISMVLGTYPNLVASPFNKEIIRNGFHSTTIQQEFSFI